MTDRAIPELDAAVELADDDQMLVWSGGATRRTTLTTLASKLGGGGGGGGTAFRGCLLKQTAYQSSTAFPGYLRWDAAIYDPEGMWNAATPDRIIPPTDAGLVRLTAGIRPADYAGAGSINTAIHAQNAPRHGLPHLSIRHSASGAGTNSQALASGPVPVEPGDWYSVHFHRQTIPALTFYPEAQTWFAIEILATA